MKKIPQRIFILFDSETKEPLSVALVAEEVSNHANDPTKRIVEYQRLPSVARTAKR